MVIHLKIYEDMIKCYKKQNSLLIKKEEDTKLSILIQKWYLGENAKSRDICEYNSPFSLKKKNQQSYASIKNKELCVNYKCKVIPVPV